MTEGDRFFTVASDTTLIDLIRRACRRLVVICPALTEPVAKALSERLVDEGRIGITVIVDADPEVYRLGFGTEAAFDMLRKAALDNHVALRVQHGVRIGVVISDDVTMVFSPVPQLIEAGSTSKEKPNAIVISGTSADRLADAAGAGPDATANRQEIGTQALLPEDAEALKADLKANPPQPYDVARALRVFSSKVQYVDLKVLNYRFSARRVELPPELLDISDDELKHRIKGSISAQSGLLGPFEIEIRNVKGTKTWFAVDERWLSKERKRIEDAYTFVVPHIGRVILTSDRPAFEREIECFSSNLGRYHSSVLAAVNRVKGAIEAKLMDEYLPKWQKQAPLYFQRYRLPATKENLTNELLAILKDVADKAISFEPPEVDVVYKNIAPESVRDPKFLGSLRSIMARRRVPKSLIASLFATVDAAPATKREQPTSAAG